MTINQEGVLRGHPEEVFGAYGHELATGIWIGQRIFCSKSSHVSVQQFRPRTRAHHQLAACPRIDDWPACLVLLEHCI